IKRRLAKGPDEAEESVRRLLEVWCDGDISGESLTVEGATATTSGAAPVAVLAARNENAPGTIRETETGASPSGRVGPIKTEFTGAHQPTADAWQSLERLVSSDERKAL